MAPTDRSFHHQDLAEDNVSKVEERAQMQGIAMGSDDKVTDSSRGTTNSQAMMSTDGYILHRHLAEGKALKAEEHTQSQGIAMSPTDKVSKAEEHTQSQEISMSPTDKVTGLEHTASNNHAEGFQNQQLETALTSSLDYHDPQDGSSNGASLHLETQFQYGSPFIFFAGDGGFDEDESPRSSGWTTPDPSMVFRFDQVTGEVIPPAGYQDGTRLPPADEAMGAADQAQDDQEAGKTAKEASDQVPEEKDPVHYDQVIGESVLPTSENFKRVNDQIPKENEDDTN